MSETGIYIRVGKDNVLLEDLNEIERTLWLQSLSENGLIRTVNRCCDVIEDFIVNYQHLQQENQLIKEELQKANDTLDTHNELIKYQKSALDEIREYIANNKETSIIYTGEVWSESVDARELEEILDKVKE